jgi:hypothetical protein
MHLILHPIFELAQEITHSAIKMISWTSPRLPKTKPIPIVGDESSSR